LTRTGALVSNPANDHSCGRFPPLTEIDRLTNHWSERFADAPKIAGATCRLHWHVPSVA
jgi:hypothetical protein